MSGDKDFKLNSGESSPCQIEDATKVLKAMFEHRVVTVYKCKGTATETQVWHVLARPLKHRFGMFWSVLQHTGTDCAGDPLRLIQGIPTLC